MLNILKRILPHICIVISVSMFAFFIVDQVNSAVNFINNQGSKIILMILCILTFISSFLFIGEMRK